MRRSKSLTALAVAVLFLCEIVPYVAQAQTVAPGTAQAPAAGRVFSFAPPVGFYLSSPKSGAFTLYGPSNADTAANWNISQWGFPSDLPPFQGNTTQTQWAKAEVSGGAVALTVNQADTPCQKVFPSGRQLANEWALFAVPNGPNKQGVPNAIPASKPSLAQLQSVQLKVTETLARENFIDSTCKVSKIFIVTAVTVVDPTTRQVLFYGTGTFHLWRGGQVVSVAASNTGGAQNMYFKGDNLQSGKKNSFGYSESVSVYGAPELQPGNTVTYNLDLLPHIVAAIKVGGQYGMDQDLSHWQIRGYYEGTTTAGHVNVETAWSNFSLNLIYQ